MATTTEQLQSTMETQADSNGNWGVEIPQTISPGMHKVMVETENGEQQDLALFNMPVRTQLIDRPVQADVGHFLYPLAFLAVLVLVLAANSLRLMVKSKKVKKSDLARKQKYTTIFTVFTALIAVILVVYIAIQSDWLNSSNPLNQNNTSLVQSQNNNIIPQPSDKIDINGLVLDPLTNQGVAGVDLETGDTNIRTEEGGAYNFTGVSLDSYLKITHPELKKTILKTISPDEGGKMDILFNIQMLNGLLQFIDNEASGDYLALYNQLPTIVSTKIPADQFIADYQPSFTGKDLAQQSIKIAKIQKIDSWTSDKYDLLFSEVVQIQVLTDPGTANYYAVQEAGEWRYIK